LGLHLSELTGTGYTSYNDAGNWYQTINRMQGNITYMYSNNEWSLYRDDARLNDAHLANVVSAADAIGKGTEFAVGGALGGFGSLLEDASLAAGRNIVTRYSQATFKSFQKQLQQHGLKAVLKTQTRIQKNLTEHVQKLESIRKAGGYASSVEREIRTFQSQLNAIDDLLNLMN